MPRSIARCALALAMLLGATPILAQHAVATSGLNVRSGQSASSAIVDHLAAGDTVREALLRSGRRRFRPVLMTSLAAMLGMLPLALALGAGSELLQPLAIAVISGLAVALLLSLVVTPTVYTLVRRKPS
jgi:multidrug efflux pump subunit AcrB